MAHNNSSSGLIWVTGYSASGKTTLSRKLESELKKLHYKTIYLDGDDLRSILGNQWKFDKSSRIELAYIYFRLCSHLSSQGYIVIISAVAMFDELLIWVKDNIPNSMQVYLNVSEKERRKRDAASKKLFLDKKMNDDSYDEPKNADLVINNNFKKDILVHINEIINLFFSRSASEANHGRHKYWSEFYKQKQASTMPSSFCKYVLDQLNKNEKLLDIGCGDGADSFHFAKNEINVTGIDLCSDAIKLCQRSNITNDINFIEGQIDCNKDLDKMKFDIIYSRYALNSMS
jgi:bifunctional enzyme CysN/CysC